MDGDRQVCLLVVGRSEGERAGNEEVAGYLKVVCSAAFRELGHLARQPYFTHRSFDRSDLLGFEHDVFLPRLFAFHEYPISSVDSVGGTCRIDITGAETSLQNAVDRSIRIGKAVDPDEQ